jgi:hypothetical protein
VITCPSTYLQVNGNTDRNVDPFCIMQFEAKNVGSVPTSQASSAPWVSLSPQQAKDACVGLGSNYNLISNQEWMTVADDIAQLTVNTDHDSNPSTTFIFVPYGNSANYTAGPVEVSNTSDHWDQTFSSQQWSYRRTYYLSSNEIIWDLSGNASEFVDWGTHASTYELSPGCGFGVNVGVLALKDGPAQCTGIDSNEYMPFDSTLTGVTNGVGRMYKYANSSTLQRGGAYNNQNTSGVYSFIKTSYTSASSGSNSQTGFRCVYRP